MGFIPNNRKISTLLYIFLIVSGAALTITIAAAYAQEPAAATQDNTGIVSRILSDETVILAIGITVTGIALKAIIAIFKQGRKQYNYRMTAVSLILGFLVSLQMVTTSMEHLPAAAGTPATVYLTIIVGEILTVMGIDSGAKAVGTKIGVFKNGKHEV